MRINLAASTDDKYARYAYVMLVSALENKKDGDEIYFFLLHAGLDDRYISDLKELEDRYPGFHLCKLEVDAARFSEKLPTDEKWSVAIYYRLLLPDILPDDVKRIIYVDVDVIINRPLNDLFNTDFDGKLICACEDYGLEETPTDRYYVMDSLIKNGKTYYNSGVLLIDVENLKKQYRFEDYMKAAFEMLDKLYAPDQDVINYVHQDEIKAIDKNKYNLFAKQAYNSGMKLADIEKNCTIVHYASQKPWRGKFIHCETEMLWWKYVLMTPYKDELTKEFVTECLSDPYVYDLVSDLLIRNKKLEEEVELRKQINDKLLSIVEGNN